MSSWGRSWAPMGRLILVKVKDFSCVLVGLCAALPAVRQQSANEQAAKNWRPRLERREGGGP